MCCESSSPCQGTWGLRLDGALLSAKKRRALLGTRLSETTSLALLGQDFWGMSKIRPFDIR